MTEVILDISILERVFTFRTMPFQMNEQHSFRQSADITSAQELGKTLACTMVQRPSSATIDSSVMKRNSMGHYEGQSRTSRIRNEGSNATHATLARDLATYPPLETPATRALYSSVNRARTAPFTNVSNANFSESSPMERWERENLNEQPWNAIGHITSKPIKAKHKQGERRIRREDRTDHFSVTAENGSISGRA